MTDSLGDRAALAIGEQYELEEEIGRGGMSVVYRARDIRLGRPVAVKVLPPELAYDPAIRLRFTREAQTAAQLSHAHIAPIYDVGEREGIAYFVMALVTGGNLAALLAREPRLPTDEVRRILRETADALAYAHMRGVIHRDVKPDNILLDGDSGRAIVTDFGIARAVEAGTRLTMTGIAVGTPAYMSPEQAMGERDADGRSDIYSLGVVGYQMLTGRVPFAAGNPMALLLKHVSEAPPPIAELRPDTPVALSAAIERALMKAPEDRWPTADALRDALASSDVARPSWRAEQRESVRYPSPRPASARRVRSPRDGARRGARADSPRGGSSVVRPPESGWAAEAFPARSSPPLPHTAPGTLPLVPEHLAALTPEQRADLRLWNGRVDLLDRIKAYRGYTLLTLGAVGLGIAGFATGVADIPPLVLSPIVPAFMTVRLWRRGTSLRQAGLRLRRVLLMPRAHWALPSRRRSPQERQLEKLAPRDILDGPRGAAIRQAVGDRAAIAEILATLGKADRALLPDLAPTADALVERVAHLARMLHPLDQTVDGPSSGASDDLVQRRTALSRQLASAGLALSTLRLDLVNFRSSGLRSALSDVATATQQARALSRDIGILLEAAAEVEEL